MAMARPARAPAELAAIEEAFAAMPDGLSRRAKAEHLAFRVAKELIALSEADDALSASLAAVGALYDPTLQLATDPEIGLHDDLAQLRIARFKARDCRWISHDAWARETDELKAELSNRLARRFRRR